MSKILIPVEFKEVEFEELTQQDVENLFKAQEATNKLNQFSILKSMTPNEILEILGIEILCKTDALP